MTDHEHSPNPAESDQPGQEMVVYDPRVVKVVGAAAMRNYISDLGPEGQKAYADKQLELFEASADRLPDRVYLPDIKKAITSSAATQGERIGNETNRQDDAGFIGGLEHSLDRYFTIDDAAPYRESFKLFNERITEVIEKEHVPKTVPEGDIVYGGPEDIHVDQRKAKPGGSLVDARMGKGDRGMLLADGTVAPVERKTLDRGGGNVNAFRYRGNIVSDKRREIAEHNLANIVDITLEKRQEEAQRSNAEGGDDPKQKSGYESEGSTQRSFYGPSRMPKKEQEKGADLAKTAKLQDDQHAAAEKEPVGPEPSDFNSRSVLEDIRQSVQTLLRARRTRKAKDAEHEALVTEFAVREQPFTHKTRPANARQQRKVQKANRLNERSLKHYHRKLELARAQGRPPGERTPFFLEGTHVNDQQKARTSDIGTPAERQRWAEGMSTDAETVYTNAEIRSGLKGRLQFLAADARQERQQNKKEDLVETAKKKVGKHTSKARKPQT